MEKRNPYNKNFPPVRLFLSMEVQRISAAKPQATALKLRSTEQKNKLKFARLEYSQQKRIQVKLL